MLDILKHWNPSLVKSENNHKIYISNYCPICKYHSKSNKRFFRYNPQLKVYKCYECGGGGKNIESLLYQIKLGYSFSKIWSIDFKRYKAKRKISSENNGFEKVSECKTEDEDSLPF